MTYIRNYWWVLGLAAGVGIIAAACMAPPQPESPPSCEYRLTKPLLEESLGLGSAFMRANQKSAGNFQYQYDWQTKTDATDDNAVRQAGALWGLALIYRHTNDPALVEPIERGLSFFEVYSRRTPDGGRYINYPGDAEGSLGTVALVSLAYIDYIGSGVTESQKPKHREALNEYITFITHAARGDGLFHAKYTADGKPFGNPSPYFDGEALLALTRAAREAGFAHLAPLVVRSAEAGYQRNNAAARRGNPDSDITKGYFQWSSMAYLSLAESGWEGTEVYGERLIELSDWMIGTHRVLERTRNTAYAFEGIISAYAYAASINDMAHVEKFRCAIENGIFRLTTWQVGSPVANEFVQNADPADRRARGGIQNHAFEAPLRIDVTQHQMHAVILALRHLPLPQ